jgi:hypothetical protein
MVAKAKEPWKKPAPKSSATKGGPKKLSPAQKSAARAHANKAGRPYPNLVDNMNVAKKAGGTRASAPSRKTSASKKK